MKLVFATHNLNKLAEIKAVMPPHIELLSLSDIGCDEPIEEYGTTLEENALIKAQYIWDNYQLNCFSDDTGLEVTALDNAPGVYSARYAGAENNAQKNMAKLLGAMEGKEDRSARFRTVIALIIQGKHQLFDGIVVGEITQTPQGDGGFGYDPIFKPEGSTRSFAEHSKEEKNLISHRGRAVAKLVSFLAS